MAINGSARRQPTRTYWEAQGIAELALSDFEAGLEHQDRAAERRAFYTLATYYQRTRRIVQSALTEHRESLAQAALHNLVVLHRPLMQMHAEAASTVPLAMVLERADRDRIVRDLVVRALSETPAPMDVAQIMARVDELDVMGGTTAAALRRHLEDLTASGHVVRVPAGFKRATRTYTEVDVDAASLRALVGPSLYSNLAEAGIRGLQDAESQITHLRIQLANAGVREETATSLAEAIATLHDARLPGPTGWRHTDLISSPYPRPYQFEAYAVFRAAGYHGELVEAPTGSGKTMIGMLCIQDWLRTLRPGQSILVLVPTANYQQQWIGELCFNPIGLSLPPELVYSGTPGQLERFTARTGIHPPIILMTYSALAQTGSGKGKGGFDVDSIETFLQLANVHYVLLDEVHKVVEDMHSVSADVTRQLTDWLRDGSIRGLIGFSGTAEAYRPRFAELGMRLAHTIPLDILVGCGYVAPFAELAVPFSSSARERRIRDLLDTYKAHVLEYVKRLGPRQVREWFAAIPIDQRVVIARRSLGMYRGRADAADATRKRMLEWEQGGEIGLANSAIVSIVQLAEGCSDLQLANRAGLDLEAFNALVDELVQIRSALESLIYVPATVSRLRLSGFATTFDASQDTADALSLTIVGLNRILSDWYLRTGEGRVETIKAIIDAERSVRPVSGAIVFDSGKRIRWRQGVTTPGYEGVAGLFGQLLGDRRFSVLAALSSEMYLTCEDADPLPPRIATFIEANMMRGEVGSAIFRLALQNLDLRPEVFERLRVSFDALVRDYLASASASSSGRPGEFRRNVLRPFQRAARQELDRKTAQRLRLRLVPGNVHLAGLIATFCEYAHIAAQFRNARVAELEQVSGAREKFFVVPMGAGPRKQLMYDLTARIVDAPDLGVNLVIVSTWARTGWNVLKPNLLIDATATRDVTAWQQLRGRAMRAPRTWTNDCYRALMALSADTVSAQAAGAPSSLLSGLNTLAGDVEALRIRACEQGLNSLSADERQALRTGLVLARNKVTHIYELVKASGSARQVELDRKARTWRRSEVVERKHAYERSVDLRSGEMRRGIDHSPLVYRSDPRTDLPADLCAAVVGTIADRDRTIVEGWLRAAAAP